MWWLFLASICLAVTKEVRVTREIVDCWCSGRDFCFRTSLYDKVALALPAWRIVEEATTLPDSTSSYLFHSFAITSAPYSGIMISSSR